MKFIKFFFKCISNCNYIFNRYPLEEKEILFLASTKMTVDYGDFSEEKTNFLKLNVGDYIPKDEVEKYDPKTWIDKIFMDYLKMKTYSKTKGKYIFVDFLRKNEEFQCTYFDGKFLFEKKVKNKQKKLNSFSIFRKLIKYTLKD